MSVLQGRISMFCSRTCCEQLKSQRNVLATCEHCKQEKVLFDTISYNQQDLSFCSESEGTPVWSVSSGRGSGWRG